MCQMILVVIYFSLKFVSGSFYLFIFIFFTLQYCIGFAIHQHASATVWFFLPCTALNCCVVKCINLFFNGFCLYVLLRNIISILRLYNYSLKMCLVIFMALFLTFNSLIHLVLNFCIKHDRDPVTCY